MHLLDAWTSLSPLDSLRLLGIPLAVLLATLLPGRGIARAGLLTDPERIPAPARARLGLLLDLKV